MRRLMCCVLMMTLLLSGCGRSNEDSPENLAAAIRAEYLNLSGWSAVTDIDVAYGEQVFSFTVDVAWKRQGDTRITILRPEEIAGISARIRDGETVLEYDGAGLSLGMLDVSGLVPVTAVPAIMDCITTGYMARCSWCGEGEGRELMILCRDPNAGPQEGTEFTLYLDPSTHALKRAEVSVDGVLRLMAQFTDFTMEMTDDETGTDPDLG